MGLVAFLAMVGFTNEYETWLYRGGMGLLALLTVDTIAAAIYPGTIGRVLSIKPLQWLGVRSYGIYLWHYHYRLDRPHGG